MGTRRRPGLRPVSPASGTTRTVSADQRQHGERGSDPSIPDVRLARHLGISSIYGHELVPCQTRRAGPRTGPKLSHQKYKGGEYTRSALDRLGRRPRSLAHRITTRNAIGSGRGAQSLVRSYLPEGITGGGD